jgi:hypothetical protein
LNAPTAVSKVRGHWFILAQLVKDLPVILFFGEELLNKVNEINRITWRVLQS